MPGLSGAVPRCTLEVQASSSLSLRASSSYEPVMPQGCDGATARGMKPLRSTLVKGEGLLVGVRSWISLDKPEFLLNKPEFGECKCVFFGEMI